MVPKTKNPLKHLRESQPNKNPKNRESFVNFPTIFLLKDKTASAHQFFLQRMTIL